MIRLNPTSHKKVFHQTKHFNHITSLVNMINVIASVIDVWWVREYIVET